MTETQSIKSLWSDYADLLWETTPYKDLCQRFVVEMDAIAVRANVDIYNPKLIDVIKLNLRSKGNRNSTINRKLSCLGKLLRKHQRDGHIQRLPDLKKYPEHSGRIRFLSSAEEGALFALLEAMNPDFANLSRFLVDTGARFSEAQKLLWKDISETTATFWETKGKAPRSVPLTCRASKAVNDAAKGRQNRAGPFSEISYQNYRYAWFKAKLNAGLGSDNQVVPHVLRHTCASRLAQSGIDMRRIQIFLGHKSITMTMKYAHLSPSNLLDCAMALNNFESALKIETSHVSAGRASPADGSAVRGAG